MFRAFALRLYGGQISSSTDLRKPDIRGYSVLVFTQEFENSVNLDSKRRGRYFHEREWTQFVAHYCAITYHLIGYFSERFHGNDSFLGI